MTHYFSASNDPSIVNELRQAIHHGNCILAVGSGLTIQAYTEEGEHPPNWVGLLEKMTQWSLKRELIDPEIADGIFLLIRGGYLIEAGQEIEEHLVKNKQQHHCLRETLLCDQARVSEIHRLIVQIPFRAYLTTNYDTFIETAYLLVKGTPIVKFYETSIQNALTEYREREDRPFILKLHGDIDNPDSIILGDRSFDRFLHHSNNYWRDLEKLLAMSTLLFIGFGLSDHDLTGILNKIDIFTHSNKHWMIISEDQTPILKAKRLRENQGVRIVQYKESEPNTELARLLKELAAPFLPIRLSSEQGVRIDKLQVINEIAQDASKDESDNSINSFHSSNLVLPTATKIFYAYYPSPEDEILRKGVEKCLRILKWKGIINDWYARDIRAEEEKEIEIKDHLNSSQIILLLVSTDFVASDYCYGNEMITTIERHKMGEVRVIPIVLRAVDYEGTPFDEIEILPTNKVPITSWLNKDEAFYDVSIGIRKVIEELKTNSFNKFDLPTNSSYEGGVNMTIEQDSSKVAEFLRSLREQIIDHPEFGRVYGDTGRIDQEVLQLASALTTNSQRLQEARRNATLYPGRRQFQDDIDNYLQGLSSAALEIERLWRQFRSNALTQTESLIIQFEEQAPLQIEEEATSADEQTQDQVEQRKTKKSWLNATLNGLNSFKNFLTVADDIKKAATEWSPGLVDALRHTLDQLGGQIGNIRF